ncbi:MAG: hypothetical protein Q4G69_09660 [Planctomycetia bacterium]|nr:hypothetical protein [Planctomycetia bacterium]
MEHYADLRVFVIHFVHLSAGKILIRQRLPVRDRRNRLLAFLIGFRVLGFRRRRGGDRLGGGIFQSGRRLYDGLF